MTAGNTGFCKSWADVTYNQQWCISQLWLGLDMQH